MSLPDQDPVCQEDSTAAGTKKHHYIHAPTGLIGIFVKEGSADTMYHVLTDHLGSLTTVINAETDQLQRYSYSSWGLPRDPDDWTSRYTGELFAGRGFTGHEHLQAFDLINMNGRVYDPVLARFLSPDPFVQFPGAVNGFNRYSYVMNNPLKFTDPSGYNLFDDLFKNNQYPGGSFYYRGMNYVYNKTKQGYDIWGDTFGNQPHSFMSGDSDFTNYDFTRNGSTGYDWDNNLYYENGNPVPYQVFHQNVILPNSIITISPKYYQAQAEMADGSIYYAEPVVWGWDIQRGYDNEKDVAANGGDDWLNNALNVNSGLGSGSGILAGNYGLTANQTFKYGVRQGGKIISASQRTAMHFSHSMNVARTLGRVNIITGTIGVAYSTNQAISDYNEGGWNQVNPWNVSDALVGAGGVTVGGLAMFGIVSNPVGWAVGIGTGLYFGGRLIYDLATTKN